MNYLRWQCPHCQTTLVTSEKKLGDQWTFSRCFNCGGFAFVRWSGIKLIKVDSNPLEESENILTPSSDQEIRAEKSSTNANTVTQTTRKEQPPTGQAPSLQSQLIANLVSPQMKERHEEKIIESSFKDAANETEKKLREQLLQGKTLSKFDHSIEPEENTARKSLFESWKNQNWMGRTVTVATAISGILAIVSGIYLYQQGTALMGGKPAVHTAQASTDEISTENEDVIKTTALAPTHAVARPASGGELLVSIRLPQVNLRSGPGVQFNTPASVRRGDRMKVIGWDGQWFQVDFAKGQRPPHIDPKTALWIRNDMVVSLNL